MESIELLAKKIKTPRQMQKFIRSMKYNKADTLSSAVETLKRGSCHCYEACFLIAAVLEKSGYPPLVMSLESKDGLDHVIYLFQEKGKWGAIAQSRDEGLFGRAPVYSTVKALARSYFDPYIDHSGKLTAYQVANLDDTLAPWRKSKRNVWKAENYLLEIRHHRIGIPKSRYKKIFEYVRKNGPIPKQKNWW